MENVQKTQHTDKWGMLTINFFNTEDATTMQNFQKLRDFMAFKYWDKFHWYNHVMICLFGCCGHFQKECLHLNVI